SSTNCASINSCSASFESASSDSSSPSCSAAKGPPENRGHVTQINQPAAQAIVRLRNPPALFRLTNGPNGDPPIDSGNCQYIIPFQLNFWIRPNKAIAPPNTAPPPSSQGRVVLELKWREARTKTEMTKSSKANCWRVAAG